MNSILHPRMSRFLVNVVQQDQQNLQFSFRLRARMGWMNAPDVPRKLRLCADIAAAVTNRQ